ncbi:MAG: hypothetical protein Q7S15_02240, partial [bacterium]|nr:hypothetical protein [bacterium]
MRASPPLLIISIFFLLFLPLSLFSQSFVGSISLTVTPEASRAFEEVSAGLVSYSTDLNRADITWILDGKQQKREVGATRFQFRAGKIGSTSKLRVVIRTIEGAVVEKLLSVRPADVDLIVEANSYVPPFYKGKALFPYLGLATIVAMPSLSDSKGAPIPAKNLVYKWKKNDKVETIASGFGKSTFVVKGTYILKPITIEVEVGTLDESVKAKGKVTLTAQAPTIVFYEKHPLYGVIYEKALVNQITLGGDEITLAPSPYYFSAQSAGDLALNYSWFMNNKTVEAPNRSTITLRKPSIAGSSQVSLRLNHISDT